MSAISDFFQNLGFNGTPSMMMFTIIAILTIIFSICLLANSKKGTSKLPPGPPALPVIGNLASLDPELHSYFARLAEKYGSILKLQLGQKLGIVVSSPSLAREVLKEHDTTFANRDVPDVARTVTYGGSDIAWTPYGPEWRMLRKVSTLKMLSNTTLDSVYALRRGEVRQTVGYLHSQVGSPVSVGEQIFLTILNVITSMLWGGTVQGEERAALGAEFRKVISGITGLLGAPNLSDFYPVLSRFDLQGYRRKMAVLAKKFDGMFDSMIDTRLRLDQDLEGEGKKDGGCQDFLQFLLKVKEEGGDAKTQLTTNQLKALLMDMVVGGTETTSNTIEFAMGEMINKPEVMTKAQQELEAVVGKDNTVEESHIHKLPYLSAIMKEILRLHPPLPLLIPHCPSENCNVGGYDIPKGARVFVNVWAIHRDPLIWENPQEFIPERFLDSRWDYSGTDFNYFPFGSGRRSCAGIAMAERMVLYYLATLLHSFDWKVPAEAKRLDLSEKFGIVLKLKTPLVAIPTPRLPDPKLYE
uniref:Cytochrome P450 family protein n=1 Tax=Rhizophora mucronata TaxID=61149 RepID=A0A2P2MZG0_RHIMU